MTPQYISRLHLKEWRCFRDIDIRLQPGINVVIGKNNVGKSALLDVIALSESTDPISAEFELSAPGHDIFRWFPKYLPMPAKACWMEKEISGHPAAFNWISTQREHTLVARFNAAKRTFEWDGINLGSYPVAVDESNRVSALAWLPTEGSPRLRSYDTCPAHYFRNLDDFESRLNRTFLLRPDRILPGSSALSKDGQLEPHGENLAGVIQYMEGRGELPPFLQLVQKVFPEIRNISVRAADSNRVEAFLWHDANDWRTGVRLSDSGRGVAPVLAILYALHFHADESCMILIDEPQAFLHANALHRLLDVFRQYPQHQFVLATHSPIVVTAPGVNQCILLKQVNGITTVQNLGRPHIAAAQSILAEVGSSLRDVFGADAVVWVEGPTEEACFPLILAKNPEIDSRGIPMLALHSTSDIFKHKTDAVAQIYSKLARANALCPPVIAFQFDREDRAEAKIKELRKRFKDSVFFTKRRMYENYLLHPEAVADLIRHLDNDRSIDTVEVEQSLDSLIAKQGGIEGCHGAKVLESVVQAITASRCDYRKVEHGTHLTQWLLEHEPSALHEVKEMLAEIFSKARTPIAVE